MKDLNILQRTMPRPWTFLLHLFREYGLNDGVCGLFLPTCPFRKARHIIEAQALLVNGVDSVVSVCSFEFPPSFAMTLCEEGSSNRLVIPKSSPLLRGKTQTQSQKPTVHPNGAIYLSRISFLKKNEILFQRQRCRIPNGQGFLRRYRRTLRS